MQEHHCIGVIQRWSQGFGMRAEPHRVAARLHRNDDSARTADFGAQAFQGGADRGGVMRKIVVDRDLLGFAEPFKTAFDAAEISQRWNHRGKRHAYGMTCRQRSEAVEHVVQPEHRPMHVANRVTRVKDCESTAVALQQTRAPVEGVVGHAVAQQAEAFDRRPAAHRQHLGKARIFAVDDQSATAGHGPHKMMELTLDRGDVGKDIGVVVFEIVEDRHQRPVVHEFAALVEECGVVFVGFDHEFAAGADARGHAEILGDAADQETRIAPGAVQQKTEDGRRGGFAVGAGDRERVAAGQHVFAQPGGSRGVVQAVIEHIFDGGITARQRIADDDLVAVGGQVFGVVALTERNAEVFELRGHRRIHRLIAAFHRVPKLPRQRGDAAHESTGDTQNMKLQDSITRRSCRSSAEARSVRYAAGRKGKNSPVCRRREKVKQFMQSNPTQRPLLILYNRATSRWLFG